MSAPQCIQTSVSQENKLVVSWDTMGTPHAILIAAAEDAEYLREARYFLVPPTASRLQLDLGAASWYVRVGALHGSTLSGHVEWSGIYGPVQIGGTKAICGEPEFALSVLHTQSMHKGFRIHTGSYDTCYVFVEVSMSGSLQASKTKWYYAQQQGRGYFETSHLEYPNVYSLGFRYVKQLPSFTPADSETFTTTTSATDDQGVTTTRITTTIVSKATPIVPISARMSYSRIQPTKPSRYADSGDQSKDRGDAQILNEAKFKQMKFGSHTDYLRFLAAQTKSGV